MYQLIFLYPPPADVDQFEADFAAHLVLLHEKAGIPADSKPYTVTRFLPTPDGALIYYLMLALHFDSVEALDAAAVSPTMQEFGTDVYRISTGGVPAILMGNSE
jgi:uncharacterized protein (TIGR02118 family)